VQEPVPFERPQCAVDTARILVEPEVLEPLDQVVPMAGSLPQEEEQASAQKILGLPAFVLGLGEQIVALAFSVDAVAAGQGALPRFSGSGRRADFDQTLLSGVGQVGVSLDGRYGTRNGELDGGGPFMTMTASIDRGRAVRRARVLNAATIGWNAVEGTVAVVAGLVAGSVSLVGFGLDSGIEVSAALVLAWRLRCEREGGCMAEADRRATRLIAWSFVLLAVYVGVCALGDLFGHRAPDASLPGIIVAVASLVVMPVCARAKQQLAPALGSRAVASEARQTFLCAGLSFILILGLSANALLGWWWADPVAGLVIAALAGAEAARTFRAGSLADTCCASVAC
jgi:hypothetical protein